MGPRTFWCVALLATVIAECQTAPVIPIGAVGFQGPIQPPAITGTGSSVVFGSSFSSAGVPGAASNVCTVNTDGSGFRQLTSSPSETPSQSVNVVSLTSDGHWVGYTASPGLHEEVHLLNAQSAPLAGSDRTIYVDMQGCVMPMIICNICSYTCLRTPHVFDDGSAVLFAGAGSPAFLVAKSDGSAPTSLPVYSGSLAASGKRVISSKGQVVFTSAAPSGPAANSAAQIFLINLDGSNLRKVTQFTDTYFAPQEATISADGSLIAFTVPSVNGATTLFAIRSDGYQFSAVAAGAISSPSLSADGTLLAYIDGGQVVLLTLGAVPVRKVLTQFQNSAAGNAAISDDGTQIAFTLGPVFSGAYYAPSNPAPGAVAGSLGTGPAAVYTVSTGGGSVQAAYAPRYVDSPFWAVAGSLTTSPAASLTNDNMVFASSLPLPQTLAGVSLSLNGKPVPLVSVSPWGIEYQIPPDVVVGADVLQPKFADGTVAAAATANIVSVLPTVIAPSGNAAVFHGNTSMIVNSTHPAAAGEVLVMYASGLGPTNPTVPAGTGAPASPPALTTNQPQVNIGSTSAQVQFSGLAPGMVGVYQINFVLPPGLKAGEQSVTIIAAGQTGGDSGYIYVE